MSANKHAIPDFLRDALIIDSEGHFHRLQVSSYYMGPRDDLLMRLAQKQGFPLRGIDRIGDCEVHMLANEQSPSVAVMLPKLKLSTYYMPNGKGKDLCLSPSFTEMPGSVHHTFEWWPQEDGVALYFVCRHPNCYLISLSYEDGRFIARNPKISNVYGDSRVCMGRSWSWQAIPLLELMRNSLNVFSASNWNLDLLPPQEYTAPIFRFHPETGQPLPQKARIKDVWPVVAHDGYNWLAALAQQLGRLP